MSKVNTNVCIITGNLTRDAELKYTATQKPVLTFSVAVNRLGQNNAQETDFFNVVLWGKPAEALQQYMTKGKGVLVRGSMRSRSYEKDGVKRTSWELIADNFGGVELLGGERQNAQKPQAAQRPQQQQRQNWNPIDVDEPPMQQPQQRRQEQSDIPF